jgi:hypothetical protein
MLDAAAPGPADGVNQSLITAAGNTPVLAILLPDALEGARRGGFPLHHAIVIAGTGGTAGQDGLLTAASSMSLATNQNKCLVLLCNQPRLGHRPGLNDANVMTFHFLYLSIWDGVIT